MTTPPHHPESTSDSGASAPQELSPAGRARRDEVLVSLQGSLVRAARRRRVARAGLAAASLTAIALAGVLAFRSPLSPQPHLATLAPLPPTAPTSDGPIKSPTPSAGPHITMATVEPLPTALCSAGQPSAAASVCLLSDDQLLTALAETGESWGLVRAAGRVQVVRNDGP